MEDQRDETPETVVDDETPETVVDDETPETVVDDEPPAVDPGGDLRAAVAQLVDGYAGQTARLVEIEDRLERAESILRRQGWELGK